MHPWDATAGPLQNRAHRPEREADAASVKLCFPLQQDDDRLPPVQTENVWARPVGKDENEVESVPWFVRGIAFGDRVLARRDRDEVLTFEKKLAWSGRYAIRVVPTGEGSARDQLETIAADFAPLLGSARGDQGSASPGRS